MSETRCEHCGDSFLCRKHATEAKAPETRYCYELPPGLHEGAARHRALSAARDEVVRAAVALKGLVVDVGGDPDYCAAIPRMASVALAEFRAAVAALARLEKP